MCTCFFKNKLVNIIIAKLTIKVHVCHAWNPNEYMSCKALYFQIRVWRYISCTRANNRSAWRPPYGPTTQIPSSTRTSRSTCRRTAWRKCTSRLSSVTITGSTKARKSWAEFTSGRTLDGTHKSCGRACWVTQERNWWKHLLLGAEDVLCLEKDQITLNSKWWRWYDFTVEFVFCLMILQLVLGARK